MPTATNTDVKKEPEVSTGLRIMQTALLNTDPCKASRSFKHFFNEQAALFEHVTDLEHMNVKVAQVPFLLVMNHILTKASELGVKIDEVEETFKKRTKSAPFTAMEKCTDIKTK